MQENNIKIKTAICHIKSISGSVVDISDFLDCYNYSDGMLNEFINSDVCIDDISFTVCRKLNKILNYYFTGNKDGELRSISKICDIAISGNFVSNYNYVDSMMDLGKYTDVVSFNVLDSLSQMSSILSEYNDELLFGALVCVEAIIDGDISRSIRNIVSHRKGVFDLVDEEEILKLNISI